MRKISLLSILILGVALVWGSTAKATCPAFQSNGVLVAGFVPAPTPSVAVFNSFGFGGFQTNAQFFGFNAGVAPIPSGGFTQIDTRFGLFGQPRFQRIRQFRR